MLDGLAIGRDRPVCDPDEDLLPRDVLDLIEHRWWRPIADQSSIEVLRRDDGFVSAPVDHPALFADHGVVHVRDIAANAVELAATVNGLLLAARPPDRQRFLAGVALLTIYLHDIGMADATPIGRRVHALVAAQLPYSVSAVDVVDRIMGHLGVILRRLETVDAAAPFGQSLDVILREVMPPVFVYLPVEEGLFVHPVGGYSPEPVPAWFPLGVTGAVRRAERNSTVIAHADVMVVMIPSAVYVAEWFKPHTAEALAHLLRTGTAT